MAISDDLAIMPLALDMHHVKTMSNASAIAMQKKCQKECSRDAAIEWQPSFTFVNKPE
ncbi:hypothetical protein [Paraburkholderia youngii]|uniref:hypothetical protein n=1 Tax=Paraburkholderia youngii TaxID=2782701 RepID=UPI003D23B1B9